MQNVKEERSVEFLCILPEREETKRLNGKSFEKSFEKSFVKTEEIKSETSESDSNHFEQFIRLKILPKSKVKWKRCKSKKCPFKTKNVEELRIHKLIVHQKRLCKICNRIFVEEEDSLNHKLYHEFFKDLKCKICSQEFESFKNVEDHLEVHGIDKNLSRTCQICSKKFHSLEAVKRHVSRYHESKLTVSKKILKQTVK